jgi:hypothetical protein
MPDYSQGKIYTIRSMTDATLIYVGSTVQPLCNRWGNYKSEYNNEKFEGYTRPICKNMRTRGFNDFYIELYEKFPCASKEELVKREGEIIREIATLNKCIAGSHTNISVSDYNKKYRLQKIQEDSDYDKHRSKNNWDKHKDKYNEKIVCECGCEIVKRTLNRHLNSKKHRTQLENIINNLST